MHRNVTKIDEEESYLAIAHSDEKVLQRGSVEYKYRDMPNMRPQSAK